MWVSKKHKHVGVQGSFQNEYMCAGHACRGLTWLRQLMEEMGLNDLLQGPTPLLGDNNPSTRLIWNDQITEGNQFFWREYHYSKECYEMKLLCCMEAKGRLQLYCMILNYARSAPPI
eukprot:SAG22_NODE_978_length_6192_cov_2.764320_4_plen_117_part_00